MQYLFSQAEDRFQLRDWGGYLCFLATADSAAARKFGVTAIVRMDQLIHDPHVHDDSDEIFYVLRGHGKQLLRNPDGTDTVYDIAPGDTVYLTKNRWHGTSNFSDSEQLDMLLINYFYDGQSNPAIRGVVPADSVPCEQAVFGSREWVLTPERCGTENVRGEVLTILPGNTLAGKAEAAEMFFFVVSGEAVSAVPEARLAAGTQLFLFRGDEYRIENRGEQAVRLFCLSADDAQN